MAARMLLLLSLIAVGCVPEDAPPAPATPPDPAAPTAFDPAHAGTVEGVVRWSGKVPRVEPFRSVEFVQDFRVGPHNRMRAFPNVAAPRVAEDGAVAGAIVFLRGIDPARARPWDLPPLSVHLSDLRLSVRQGGQEGHAGIARAGTMLRVVSEDAPMHTVQARGAAFFGLTLPEKGCERRWRLDEPGLVELRSGAGFFWMRGLVLASEHPYAAVTDHRGRFRFESVPEGKCEVVALHPDWRVRETERNPDSSRVSGVSYGPPLESAEGVRTERGKTVEAVLRLKAP